METDEKLKPNKINTNNLFEYPNIPILQKVESDFYNVSAIESKISDLEENCRTQSLIALSDVTFLNSNQHSMCSINVSDCNSEKNFTSNVSIFLKDVVEDNYNSTVIIPLPQVLFIAPKRCKRSRQKQLPPTFTKQNFQKCTRLCRPKIVHLKYKHPEKNIRRKLETYCGKTKRNGSNPRQIQQDLCTDLILNTVSRSRILKKVLAKKNLLDGADKVFLQDINQDRMLINDPSEDTLTCINSESSQNDSINTKTTPSVVSVVEIPTLAMEAISTHTIVQTQSTTSELSRQSHESFYDNESEAHHSINKRHQNNVTTFKTDMINVAIAQITDASILKYNIGTSSEQSREEMLYKENLTSAESFMTQSDDVDIISTVEISETNTHNSIVNENEKTCIVITDMVNTFHRSSESDTCAIAKTSSYFKGNSDSLDMSSNRTLTPSSELTNQTEPSKNYFESNHKGKSTLLDTIINVEMFHLPISSSENEYSTENANNVIITDELRKILPPHRIPALDNYSKNVIQKPFSIDMEDDWQKRMLPNKDPLRSILTETEKTEKKPCSEDFRRYAPPPDVWEKLVVFLDISMRRMEDSLVQKIGNELKNSLDKFEKYFPFPIAHDYDFLKSDTRSYNKSDKNDFCKMESGSLRFMDQSLQCGMVQNEVIDKLMSKIKIEEVVDNPLKLIKSRIRIRRVNDSFEILKPPVIPCTSKGISHGDSLLTSSSEGVRVPKLRSSRYLMRVLSPIQFFKANMLVLTSVPAFFVSIFLVYNFFILLL